MIRVLVVDDHPVTSAGIRAALAEEGDIEVVGCAATPEEALAYIASTHPDVVLCDIQLGEQRVLDLPRHLLDPAPAVIFLTSYDYPSYVRAAFESGAAGYVLKSTPLSEIVGHVRSVAAGGTAYSARDLRAARQAPRTPSEREMEVVALVAAGTSNAEIGRALGIEERTVESHLRRLFDRYGVDSRTELTTFALRAGWIDMPPR
jgi:DNA-binding NarL/FixJ family response regulator